MTADGFDGHTEEFELALGHVTGVRGFLQDSLGRLTGVTYTRVFRPGMNVATCDHCKTEKLDECSCGYYAYFDQPSGSYGTFYGGEIGAVVRGYGRTIVGTKGFRAEKADLLALFPINTVGPKKTGLGSRKPSSFRSLYPTASWFVKHGNSLGPFISSVSVLGATAAFVSMVELFRAGQSTAGFLALVAGLIVFPWLSGLSNRLWNGNMAQIDIKYPSLPQPYLDKLHRLCRGSVVGTPKALGKPDPFERLRVIYPNVPVYDSYHEAIETHPLTPADEHRLPETTPENDPDFWDRQVTAISSAGPFASGGYITGSLNATGITWGTSAGTPTSPTGRLSQSIPSIQGSRGGIVFNSTGASEPLHNPFVTGCRCPLCTNKKM